MSVHREMIQRSELGDLSEIGLLLSSATLPLFPGLPSRRQHNRKLHQGMHRDVATPVGLLWKLSLQKPPQPTDSLGSFQVATPQLPRFVLGR